MPTLATKTYTPTNGTANDGTPLNAELAVLFNNDDLLNTAISDISNNANFATATTLTLNSSLAGAPSVNVSYAVERGSAVNVSLRWNETSDIWEYTNDGTNFFPIGPHILDADPTPIDGQIWSNRTEDTVRHYNGTLSETFAGHAGLRANTGTTDTILTTDRNKVITQNNASAVAVTLPQANSTGFKHNFAFHIINLGAGLVTITPSTSTINGAATFTLRQGSGVSIYSDNTNYFAPIGQIPAVSKFVPSSIVYADGAVKTFAHGFGAEPDSHEVWLECVTGEYGWSTGNKIKIQSGSTSNNTSLVSYTDATNVTVVMPANGTNISVKTTGIGAYATPANWKVFVKAYKF